MGGGFPRIPDPDPVLRLATAGQPSTGLRYVPGSPVNHKSIKLVPDCLPGHSVSGWP
jgi:hypothetical protein